MRLSVYGGPDKFFESIVDEVSHKLRAAYADVHIPDHLVGMEGGVDISMRNLNLQSGDVRFLLIYGKGDMGKTALAKLLFNRLSNNFEGCIFLYYTTY